MINELEYLITKSGWYHQREIEISHHLEFFYKEEYTVFDKATEFLKEFGDLIIEFENPKRHGNYLTLSISPIQAAGSVFREVSRRYERYSSQPFAIVGEIDSMDMTWYISQSGVFWGGFDDFLVRLGDDFYQALTNMIQGTKLEIIVVEEDD